MGQLEKTILLVFLFILAWIDHAKKEVPLLLPGSCAVVGVLFSRIACEWTWSDITGGVCVGGVLLLGALLMRDSIGPADGLMFCATGTWLGLWRNLFLLCGATVLCGVVGAVLLLAKRCTRKDTLAFAPFVLMSYAAMLTISV